MKSALISLAIVVAVAVSSWLLTFTYWHFRITSALKAIEDQAVFVGEERLPKVPTEHVIVLEKAGCRALPYVVERCVPSQTPAFLVWASLQFRDSILAQKEVDGVREHLLWDLLIQRSHDPDYIHPRCDAIHDWWRKYGDDYHKGWRVWTSRCGGE